jgi:hypothetical protein
MGLVFWAMALLAGIRRIKLLGLIVAIVGALIAFLYWLAAPPYVPLVPLISIPLLLGAVIYAFGADRRVRPARCQAAIDSPAATVWVIAYLMLSCRTCSPRPFWRTT